MTGGTGKTGLTITFANGVLLDKVFIPGIPVDACRVTADITIDRQH